ncbi:hypothetical protein P153DRAFT_353365 [Dothidotthia symphoricarpi CBS 119687]|uniref:Uncharacterized protein n=1 Tax=Dothidotthia symphoricarpi CBS 119687 TaxID=1392245 RepID=A0A6A6ASM9_9PLEO|nr:uncharacterized protein P153DRAFT_353365 [Dothidotthia symphoricarpi CBS 119687]KAF2134178.1 hypothetical protein P153DRAFT_353365 [Dothidotthia symphoricarpi CBS 119687]
MPAYNGRGLYSTGNIVDIPLCWAGKDLHDGSMYPYVYESTLPQHRLNEGKTPRPSQNEYPVWYFLTGTLARADKLQRLLKLDVEPETKLASITSLREASERQCKALVELPLYDSSHAHHHTTGTAYLVKNEREEEAMRYFKTSFFQVKRTKIRLHARTDSDEPEHVDGLVFALVGSQEILREMVSWPIAQMPNGVGSMRRTPAFIPEPAMPHRPKPYRRYPID